MTFMDICALALPWSDDPAGVAALSIAERLIPIASRRGIDIISSLTSVTNAWAHIS